MTDVLAEESILQKKTHFSNFAFSNTKKLIGLKISSVSFSSED